MVRIGCDIVPKEALMLLPPVLEVYVAWHPDDEEGRRVADWLLDHFHGTAFSGLVGGAVEVYIRNTSWRLPGDSPRPMPFMAPLPAGLSRPTMTAVLPVLGVGLARAVQSDRNWADYVAEIGRAADQNPDVGVYPLLVHRQAVNGTRLADLLGSLHRLPPECAEDRGELGRELAQGIAQVIGDPMEETLQVFVSHTKRHAPDEESNAVSDLVSRVLGVLSETHLLEFFDQRSLQPGERWEDRLEREASRSCMLAIRTDLYASRSMCQHEVRVAKEAELPVVVLHAITGQEERGSFLLDHVPSVQTSLEDPEATEAAVRRAVNVLVDEALKRVLWRHQRPKLDALGFDWLPVHAPEPVTLLPRLVTMSRHGSDEPMMVMHPDPPLGSDETQVLELMCEVAGLHRVEVLTPRTFAGRGGQAQL
jgi:hypothetical protein